MIHLRHSIDILNGDLLKIVTKQHRTRVILQKVEQHWFNVS